MVNRMTNKEAIEILKEYEAVDDSLKWYMSGYSEAFDMAIKALEQSEPCNDDKGCSNCMYSGRPTYKSPCSECRDNSQWEMKPISRSHENSTECEDTISRQAAIDDLNGKDPSQIWDTAGEERFRTVVSTYFRGAHGILLLYDVTNRDSFKNLENWLIEIEKNSSEKVLKILLGNKCDLNDDREIQPDEGRAFADRNGMEFMETSAKMNTNVNEAFETLGKLMIEFNSKNNNKTQQGENKTFKANSGKDLNTKKKCC